MATTATVLRDDPEPNGKRWCVLRYDFDTAPSFTTFLFKLAEGVDAQAYANSKIEEVEARRIEDELNAARETGSLMVDLPNDHVTRADKREANCIAILNRLETRETALPEDYINLSQITDAGVAALVGRGWTPEMVSEARAKLNAYYTAFQWLPHGNGEIEVIR